ncbi:MAG: NAD(P)H-dependent flavin oxidoreductase [Flavobacteriales bacterium]
MNNKVTQLFGIKYPLIQAGMIWCSGWELASAVSNAGGLGIIGSGSMYPEILREHIIKCKAHTKEPFAVNLPLLYPQINDHIAVIVEEGVKIVFTSAGNPAKWTQFLKEKGITVVHVVSNEKFALKAVEAGVDAVVAEGFEAGGHNGREETTTMCLIPQIRKAVDLPLIAAGGIGNGKAMLAAFALGADGVQIGSRFIASPESSAHQNFKEFILHSKEGDTQLMLKEITPVRLLKNNFYNQLIEAYKNGATKEELVKLLGRGRAKKGMFMGDMIQGELEVGQVSSLINSIKPAAEIVNEIMTEFKQSQNNLSKIKF